MSQDKSAGAGERLKQLRLDKGLTVNEVHKKTKIPLKILEDIEEGRATNINPVYVKGFLKIYCRLLGVDAQEFIMPYADAESFPEKYIKKEKQLFSKPKISLPLFYKSRFKPKTIIIAASILIAGFVIVKAIGAKKASARREHLPPRREEKATSVMEKKTVSSEDIKPQTQESPRENIKDNIRDNIKVGIRARDDCWVKATVDGKVIFQTILKKGRFETWQAKDKIELSLGNAGGVDLEVNGRMFSPLGRRGQIIRRVLINKDGLQVLR